MTVNDHPFYVMTGMIILLAPICLTTIIGLLSLFERPVPERWMRTGFICAIIVSLAATVTLLAMMSIDDHWRVTIELIDVATVPGYHFSASMLFDALSISFLLLVLLLCGTVSAFSLQYMHREPGFHRYFILFSLFMLGMIVTTVAGSIEMMFVGWELVGLSSALLVGYFHERQNPVRNGLYVWSIYRIADAAFLVAAILIHEFQGFGHHDSSLSKDVWPEHGSMLTEFQAICVGLLLILTAAGKSALLPFCGWLPKAMEGPTPSSAIFYGALSVHLGAFLMLRFSATIELSFVLCALLVVLGLATALHALIVGRVQSDIKSALAYESLTQVGIIIAEIGFGLRYLALVHLITHACLRTIQFLRAPTVLHDFHSLENAIGGPLPRLRNAFAQRVSEEKQTAWYRYALHRGFLDDWLLFLFVKPTFGLFRQLELIEQRWLSWLRGEKRSDRSALGTSRNGGES